MLAKALQGGTSAAKTYVDDVFSTYLYAGNNSSRTINNGLDLSGKGGMVWVKSRSGNPGIIFDTLRGTNKYLRTDTNAAETSGISLSAFNSNGFNLAADPTVGYWNANTQQYVAWAFREQPKFFDVVTYTGNGTIRTIAHSLGSVPGFMLIKSTSTAGYNWVAYHRSLGATKYIYMDASAQSINANVWNNTAPTSTVFTVGTDAEVNANGTTYVAYLFAHETAADDLIQCGTYTGNGASSQTITLGWEPQFIISKMTNNDGSESAAAQGWRIVDVMRGMPNGYDNARLQANDQSSENQSIDSFLYSPLPTGFRVESQANTNTKTYVYIAIRRPNKPPTSGTEVFSPNTSAAAEGTKVTTNFPVDVQIFMNRTSGSPNRVVSRLTRIVTGVGSGSGYLSTNATTAETYSATVNQSNYWDNTGFNVPGDGNTVSTAYWSFRRAPGFFDQVCYTGTGVARTISHNLGAVPEMIIVKSRGVNPWDTYHIALGNQAFVRLNEGTAAYTAMGAAYWNSTNPTSTVFSVGTDTDVNGNGTNYTAYLFATLSGISKVGSYTGNGGTANTNGTSQTINCGFSAGSRFVLIRRTNAGGDWFVFDTARGIVSANDPYMLLNGSAAEVTTVDAVDPDNSGFIVNQTSGTNLNVTGASYIFLAVS